MQSSRMEARLSARSGSAMFGPVRTRSECVVHVIKPEQITAEMVEELRRLSPFDPEHLPGEILLTEAFQRRFADLPQVASFDTAFHHDLPRVARLLPIPRRYEAQGVRRYGFHGLSYAFLMRELARLSGPAGDLLLELSMYYRFGLVFLLAAGQPALFASATPLTFEFGGVIDFVEQGLPISTDVQAGMPFFGSYTFVPDGVEDSSGQPAVGGYQFGNAGYMSVDIGLTNITTPDLLIVIENSIVLDRYQVGNSQSFVSHGTTWLEVMLDMRDATRTRAISRRTEICGLRVRDRSMIA